VRLCRFTSCAVVTLLALLASATVSAQAPIRVRVTRATVVMERARGDSVIIGRVTAGTVLEFLGQSGRYYEVSPASGSPSVPWRRGWIYVGDVEFLDARPQTGKARPADWMIRGFGHVSGTLFTAHDSFEALFDSSFGPAFGAGGQVVFPNRLFVQGSFERFKKTGGRVIVAGEQLFSVPVPNTVTVTPVLATVGYRDDRSGRIIGYGAGGIGWHMLEESSPSLLNEESVRKGHLGFHVSGGAEFQIAPFIWLAGEVQWATVPDALGEPGIGAVFDEKDLGGTTFGFKLIVGR
jgi:hypothetical protein